MEQKIRIRWNPPPTTKIRAISGDQINTVRHPCDAGNNSHPGRNPFVVFVLVGERKWDEFEDPPQWHSPQLVVNTLYSILGILRINIHLGPVLGCGSVLLLGLVCVLVSTKGGGDVPLSERIQVKQDRAVCLYDLLDHPAKWNISERMFDCVQDVASADICVPSAYDARWAEYPNAPE